MERARLKRESDLAFERRGRFSGAYTFSVSASDAFCAPFIAVPALETPLAMAWRLATRFMAEEDAQAHVQSPSDAPLAPLAAPAVPLPAMLMAGLLGGSGAPSEPPPPTDGLRHAEAEVSYALALPPPLDCVHATPFATCTSRDDGPGADRALVGFRLDKAKGVGPSGGGWGGGGGGAIAEAAMAPHVQWSAQAHAGEASGVGAQCETSVSLTEADACRAVLGATWADLKDAAASFRAGGSEGFMRPCDCTVGSDRRIGRLTTARASFRLPAGAGAGLLSLECTRRMAPILPGTSSHSHGRGEADGKGWLTRMWRRVRRINPGLRGGCTVTPGNAVVHAAATEAVGEAAVLSAAAKLHVAAPPAGAGVGMGVGFWREAVARLLRVELGWQRAVAEDLVVGVALSLQAPTSGAPIPRVGAGGPRDPWTLARTLNLRLTIAHAGHTVLVPVLLSPVTTIARAVAAAVLTCGGAWAAHRAAAWAPLSAWLASLAGGEEAEGAGAPPGAVGGGMAARRVAASEAALMVAPAFRKRKAAIQSSGLVILHAAYGDLAAFTRDARSDATDGLALAPCYDPCAPPLRPWIDVTLPLQFLCTQEALQIPDGVSKANLMGFCRPSSFAEGDTSEGGGRGEEGACRLCVRYVHNWVVHEAVVGDREALVLPNVEHMLPSDAMDEGVQARLAGWMAEEAEGVINALLLASRPP